MPPQSSLPHSSSSNDCLVVAAFGVRCRVRIICCWFLLIILLVLLVPAAIAKVDSSTNTKKQQRRRRRRRPHILFIVADDFGWNDVGYHQNRKSSANPQGLSTTNAAAGIMKTPTIDKLAAEGVKLENYYVQQLCSPTRASIMTGRYSSHTGIGPNVDRIDYPYGVPAEEVFFPELLKRVANYSTHMVGKWHLGACHEGYHPTFRGFDSYVGYLAGGQGYYRQSGDRNSTCGNHLGPCLGEAFKYNYSSTFFAHESKRIIEHHAASQKKKTDNDDDDDNNNNPLFLYLAFQSVHNPYDVPPINVNTTFPSIYSYQRRIYAGMIQMMDDAIRDVVHAFKKQHMWDDTVVIFTSDNGGIGLGSNYPLRGRKGFNWEGGIKAVGFVRGTNNPHVAPLPPNTTCDALLHSTDWFLTVTQGLAGIETIGKDADDKSSLSSSSSSSSSSSLATTSESTTTTTTARTPLPLDGYNQWKVLAQAEKNHRTSIFHQVPVGAKPINTGKIDPETNQTIWTTSMCMHWVDNRTAAAVCSPFGVTGGALRHGDFKLLITHPGDAPWVDTSSITVAHQIVPGGDYHYPNGSSIFVPPTKDIPPIPYQNQYFLFDIANDPTERTNLAETMPEKFQELLQIYEEYATTSAKSALNWRWGFTDPTWKHNPQISSDMRTSSDNINTASLLRTSRSLLLFNDDESSSLASSISSSSSSSSSVGVDEDNATGDKDSDNSIDATCMGPFLGSEYCSYGHEWECFVQLHDLEGHDITIIDPFQGGTIECQAHCQATENCTYWVFISSSMQENQICKLKSARGNLVPCPDCVFGPKVCPS